MWFPTCQFYCSKCDSTRPPILGSFCKHLRNFVIKTFQSCHDEYSNGGLQGGLDFLNVWLCYSQDLILWLLSEKFLWKRVKFGLFWLSRLKFWLTRNETFYGIWLLWLVFWQNVLDLPPFWTLWWCSHATYDCFVNRKELSIKRQ